MLQTGVVVPANKFYGDHLARITNPHNNQWSVSTHIEDLTPDQIALSLVSWPLTRKIDDFTLS